MSGSFAVPLSQPSALFSKQGRADGQWGGGTKLASGASASAAARYYEPIDA
jgi:hypothetical protein